MKRCRVVAGGVLPAGPLEALGRDHDVLVHTPGPAPRQWLLEQAPAADALLVLCTQPVDAALLEAAPRLRILANFGVGVDNIDLAAARARRLVVTNTPDVLTESTADLAMLLLLAAARRLPEGEAMCRAGAFAGWEPTMLLGTELAGKTLGIFGLGRIGAAVARRARAFGMRIVYNARHRAAGELEAELAARFVGFDELVETSDAISLHAPLTAETRHRFDAAVLARLRPGAILVNAARGPLVDEEALIAALETGRLRAGLDVYEHEPAIPERLRALPNVVLLPHLGSATNEARLAMAEIAVGEVARVLSGKPPFYRVA